MTHPSLDDLSRWYDEKEKQILDEFFQFLSMPSISTDPSYHSECLKTADFLLHYLKKIGMTPSLWTNPGLPVVFAEHKASASAPTVLIYQHYDVQPVDPLELWSSDPFRPVIKEGKVYARGASDNKGQCFATLTALAAVLHFVKDLDVNIKLFIEGEEESGGAGTQVTLEEKKDLLKADYVLVVDFDMPEENTPGITLGMRGIATFNLEVQNSRGDLHSGVHGGIALNPLRALCDVLSKMWDHNGKISIDHFYDKIEPLSDKQRERLNLSFDAKKYNEDFGVKAFCNETGLSIKESNWLRPTLEINGLWGGYTGVGFKTVIPAKAFAKISCRLLPGQDPDTVEEQIRDFLKKNIAEGIDFHLEPHHGARAFRCSAESNILHFVESAQKEVFGKTPQYSLCGASVPIVTDLARVSGGEVALFGTSLSSDDFHAPNEHFSLARMKSGCMTMAKVLLDLASGARGRRPIC